jgi:hypothetical protein
VFLGICLLLAVRYPDVPRSLAPSSAGVTNLFPRRLSIAVAGSVVVLSAGTLVILRLPTQRSIRILELGVPAVALLAAISMPVVTICPPPGIGEDGYCRGYLFMHIVEGIRSSEIPARLAIVTLGCLGGFSFWVLAKTRARRTRSA